jgi:hypothetical protein
MSSTTAAVLDGAAGDAGRDLGEQAGVSDEAPPV